MQKFQMWLRLMEQCRTLLRAVLDLGLYTLGLLNILPLFSRPNRQRQTIVFQTFSTHLAQCYEPIITRLRSDAPHVHLQLMILLHPHVPLREVRSLRQYARDVLQISGADVFLYWQKLWSVCDVLVCGDVYARFPLRKTRTILLPHGTGLMPRMFEPHPWRKSMVDFDRILLAGSYDVNAVRTHPKGETLLPRVMPLGFPFLDLLQHLPCTREQYCAQLGLDPAQRIILFAPHWTVLQATGAIPYVQETVAALKALQANLIVKLHTCSFYPAMARGVDWRPIVQELARDCRVHLDEDIDDRLALGYADILISDFSSRAFVCMALDKPVVLRSPAGADPIEETGARMTFMRSGSFLAHSASEVAELVQRFLQAPTPHPAGRALAEQCFTNLWQATQPVVNMLQHELTL